MNMHFKEIIEDRLGLERIGQDRTGLHFDRFLQVQTLSILDYVERNT
jgi:hypothetical protein